MLMTREANVYLPELDSRLGMISPAEWPIYGPRYGLGAATPAGQTAGPGRKIPPPKVRPAPPVVAPGTGPAPVPLFEKEGKNFTISDFVQQFGPWIGVASGALLLVGLLRPRSNPPRRRRRSRR